MTDSPLYDATLSDLLLRARRESARAHERATLATRRALEHANQREQEARKEALTASRKTAEAVRRIRVAEEQAARRVAEAQRIAAERVLEAERRAALSVRQERVRRALVAEEVEDRVRHELALDAPPLPDLAPRIKEPERVVEPARSIVIPTAGPSVPEEPVEAPPVPSMADLLKPSPGVSRFLDTLLGPST